MLLMPWHTVIMCPCTHLYSVVIGHISHQMKLHSDLADVLSNYGLACKSVFLWCVISVSACGVSCLRPWSRHHQKLQNEESWETTTRCYAVRTRTQWRRSGMKCVLRDAVCFWVCWGACLPKIEKSQEVHSSSVPNMTFCSPSLSLSGPTVDICVCVTHSFSIQK